MKLGRFTPPGDDTSRYPATEPYGQPTGGSSSSTSPVVPIYSMSTSDYYADPTTSFTSYAAYPTSSSTVYDFPITSSSSDYSLLSTTSSGPAAISQTSTTILTGVSTPLSTLSSLSPFLTNTAQANTSISSTNRTALIAALVAGLSALLIFLFVAFLLYKRRRRRRDQRLDPRVDSRSLPHSALLRDDEMAYNTRMALPTTAQYGNSALGDAMYRPASPSLSILRTRVSESGSIFREEVWPPPSPTIDPIQMRSSQVDLSRIVEDVMGPVDDGDPRRGHKRELTATSMTPLLFERQTSSIGHGSSEEDLTRAYSSPFPLYLSSSPNSPPIDLPDVRHYGPVPEAFAPVMQTSQGQSSVTSVSSSLYSRPGPPSGSVNIQSPTSFRPPSMGSLHGSVSSSILPQSTQPKVSSPLVRAITGFGVGNNGRQSSHP